MRRAGRGEVAPREDPSGDRCLVGILPYRAAHSAHARSLCALRHLASSRPARTVALDAVAPISGTALHSPAPYWRRAAGEADGPLREGADARALGGRDGTGGGGARGGGASLRGELAER